MSVIRPPRDLARLPASFNAPSVAFTEVKTTEMLSLESDSSLNARSGTPVSGAIMLSRASAIGFRLPRFEGRTWSLKKSLERDKELVKRRAHTLMRAPLQRLSALRGRFEHGLQR